MTAPDRTASRRRLRRAVLPALALGAVLAIVSWLLFELYRSNERVVMEEVLEHQRPMAMNVARQVDTHLRLAGWELRAMGGRPAIAGPADAAAAVLDEVLGRPSDLHLAGAAVYDAGTGAAVATRRAVPARLDAGVLGRARAVREGVLTLAPPRSPDGFVLLLGPAQGGRLAALSVDVHDLLDEQARNAGEADDRGLWVLGGGGDLIFHSQHPRMEGRSAATAGAACAACHEGFEHVAEMRRQREGTISYQLRGYPRKLAAFAPMDTGGLGWTVAVNVDYRHVTALSGRNLWLAAAILTVVTVSLLAAAALVDRNQQQKLEAEHEAGHWRARRALEEEVRHAREYLEALVQNPLDAIFTVRRDGTIAFVNRRFAQLTGTTVEHIQGRPLRELLDPSQRDAIEEHWREIGPDGTGTYEIQLTVAGGRPADCLVSQSPVHGFDETLVVLKDISERKKIERALRDSEGRLRGLLQGVPGIVWEADAATGQLTFVSERAEAILGYPLEEWSRSGFRDRHVHPDDRARVGAVWREAALHGGDHEIEYRAVARGGELVWFHGSVSASEDRRALHGLMVDVTDHRRAQEEQARLQAALSEVAGEWQRTCDALSAAILVLDVKGRVRRLNRAARDLVGGQYRDCLGRALADLDGWEPAQEGGRVVMDAVRDGHGGPVDVRDEAARRWWELTATRADWDGDSEPRVLLVARDITPTVQLQESVRRAETMAAMGALTAGVAHEVRNPLFALSANVDALEAVLDDAGPVQEIIEAVRREVSRMSELMEDLLEYGRPVTTTLVPAPFQSVVEDALVSCAALARQAAVTIAHGPGPCRERVAMDRPRLAQVLANLLENAIQHSPPGGTVEVTTRCFDRGERRYVAWEVADGGPGFREGDLARIFEPFFTRRRGGTGLGLSIAQRIAEHHEARIHASNGAAGGAVMRLEMPCAPA